MYCSLDIWTNHFIPKAIWKEQQPIEQVYQNWRPKLDSLYMQGNPQKILCFSSFRHSYLRNAEIASWVCYKSKEGNVQYHWTSTWRTLIRTWSLHLDSKYYWISACSVGWFISLLVHEEVLLAGLCKRKILLWLEIYDRLRQATTKRACCNSSNCTSQKRVKSPKVTVYCNIGFVTHSCMSGWGSSYSAWAMSHA